MRVWGSQRLSQDHITHNLQNWDSDPVSSSESETNDREEELCWNICDIFFLIALENILKK